MPNYDDIGRTGWGGAGARLVGHGDHLTHSYVVRVGDGRVESLDFCHGGLVGSGNVAEGVSRLDCVLDGACRSLQEVSSWGLTAHAAVPSSVRTILLKHIEPLLGCR
jgi:hypothetical protein